MSIYSDGPSLNGYTVLGDLNIEEITADTGTFGTVVADNIIGGTLTYQSTTTNGLTVNSILRANFGTFTTLEVWGNATLYKNLEIKSNLSILGDLYVAGQASFTDLSMRSLTAITGNISTLSVFNLNAQNLTVSGLNVSTLDTLTIRKLLTVSGSCVINSGLTVGNGVAGGTIYDPNQVVGYMTTSSLKTNFVVHNTAVSGGQAAYNLTANSNYWDIQCNALDDKLIFFDQFNDKSGMWLQRYNDGADLYVSRSLLAVGGRFTNLSATNLTADNFTFPTNLSFTDLTVRSLVATAQADFQNISSPGYSIITSGSIVCGNRMDVRGSSFLVSGTATIGSGIHISGNATVASSLTVSGAVSLASNTEIMGELTLKSILTVSGQTTLASSLYVGGAVSIASSLLITGATTQIGTLTITGNTTSFGAMSLLGNATISDTLTVAGKDPAFGYEARINMKSNANTNAIVSYDTGAMGILNNNTLSISGQTNCQNTLTVSNGRLIEEISNSNDYTLLQLKNNNSAGMVAFVNGSTRTADGGAGVGTIRMDNGSTLRIQDNFSFNYGNSLNILGDPTATPLQQGGASLNEFIFTTCISAGSYIYVGGSYLSNSNILVKNFDNSSSGWTLPSSSSKRRAFIIQYTTAGIANNAWYLTSTDSSEIKMLYVGANKFYAVGSYASTSNITILDIDRNPSGRTLPLTSVTPNYYAGFLIGFDTATGTANRHFTINGVSTNSARNFVSCVIEDSSGNVFAGGTVITFSGAGINNLANGATGQSLGASSLSNGFIIRWDLNGNYTGHWGWNDSSFDCFVNDITVVPGGNTLYCAMSVYNLGFAVNIKNWNGAGGSAYNILASSSYSTAYWSSVLVKFTGITTIAAPTVSGRQSFGNTNQTFSPFPISSCCYSTVYNTVYWSTPVAADNHVAFFINMTDGAYNLTVSPPQSSSANVGIMTFIINHNASGNIATYPGTIWTNGTAYSGNDFIYRIRQNSTTGHIYLQGGVYSDNTPTFQGMYEVGSRIKFPFNTTPGTNYYYAFSIILSSGAVQGMSVIPYSTGQSYSSDICFPSNSRAIAVSTINNHTSQYVSTYEQYNSVYPLPITAGFNMGVLVDYALTKNTTAVFSRGGVGIGMAPNGAELCVDKGIYTNTFIQCNEIRVNDFTRPFKITDNIGREIGSLCRAWVCLDSLRSFQPVIKASMNVRYLDKTANGKYRIYFSQYAPHDRFCTVIGGTGYLGNNYTIFPFIITSNAVIGAPNAKFIYGIEVGNVQTGGTGFDTRDFNVACFW